MTFMEGTCLLNIEEFKELEASLDKLVNEVKQMSTNKFNSIDEKVCKWTDEERYLNSPDYKYGEKYQGI